MTPEDKAAAKRALDFYDEAYAHLQKQHINHSNDSEVAAVLALTMGVMTK